MLPNACGTAYCTDTSSEVNGLPDGLFDEKSSASSRAAPALVPTNLEGCNECCVS